jgi:hypothetical protein
MNWTDYIKEKGATRVNLTLQRRAIYASVTAPVEKETTVKAWKLGDCYSWGRVGAFRRGSFLEAYSGKARWEIIEETT